MAAKGVVAAGHPLTVKAAEEVLLERILKEERQGEK